jgi:hypothetical protein
MVKLYRLPQRREMIAMPYTSTAPTEYLADELAKVIDIPEAFRGAKIQLIGPGAHISKGGVVYYPFQSDAEVSEWTDAATSAWWNDETI